MLLILVSLVSVISRVCAILSRQFAYVCVEIVLSIICSNLFEDRSETVVIAAATAAAAVAITAHNTNFIIIIIAT